MTKLEELSELLVSEIKEFQETVKKLEEIRKSKIQLDLQNLQSLLYEHQQVLKLNIEQNNQYRRSAEKLNNETKSYFKKAMVIIAVGFFLNVLLMTVVLST